MNYIRGFQALKECLARADVETQSQLATLEQRFWKNERAERIFGDSENARYEYSQIVYAINQFALEHCGVSFTDFCLSECPIPQIRVTAVDNGEVLTQLRRIETKLNQPNAGDLLTVNQIHDAIAHNQIDQFEAVRMVVELRSWARAVQKTRTPLSPELHTAVESLAGHTGSAYEYLQLAITIIPSIISYNIELGSEHTLDLKSLWGKITASLVRKGKANHNTSPPGKTYYGIGKAWAILVGINQYNDPSIASLKVCVEDVTAIREVFAESYQIARLLTDDTPKHLPTRSNILGELSTIAQAASREDLLLFYFSGHGIAQDGESYLLPCDTRISALRHTAVAMRDVHEIIEQSTVHAKVLILDACHSGASIGKAETMMAPEFIRHVFEEAEGMAVLASCKENQQSWEWPEQRRSVFTYYLLEALSGKADFDKKNFVTVSDASRYVTDSVKTWAAEKGVPQTPTLQYTVAGDIVLIRYH